MRILVIEDEPRILGFLYAGWKRRVSSVVCAEDGVVASRGARERLGALILDLLLPGWTVSGCSGGYAASGRRCPC